MPKPNASIVLSSRDATGGRPQNGNLYNQLLFNAQNQNIVQGQIHSVELSEINFPYDIPNMQEGFNFFFLDVNGFSIPGMPLEVALPVGFYTGTELAAGINALITTAGAALPTPLLPAQMPTVAFSTSSGLFTFTGPTAPLSPQYNNWFLVSPYTFPMGIAGTGTVPNTLGKDILSIMGFLPTQEPNNISALAPINFFQAAQTAPLTFTQYIDICSPQLCKFQYFRDGSTTNLARRSDVICRLYIANNVATQEEEGTRPFVIHRQFFNSRKMRWTADNAVGTIDINLYDDVGQPLTTTWAPRPYQITFNCYEDEKKEAGNVTGDGSIMEKFANYVARNEGLWSSRSYPLS
jgi:hypothetical protein